MRLPKLEKASSVDINKEKKQALNELTRIYFFTADSYSYLVTYYVFYHYVIYYSKTNN